MLFAKPFGVLFMIGLKVIVCCASSNSSNAAIASLAALAIALAFSHRTRRRLATSSRGSSPRLRSTIDATLAAGGSLLITADHGNAERMWNTEGRCPHTAHTNFDVPLHLVGHHVKDVTLQDGGRLADIGPTILELMGLPAPEAMTGQSLIRR